MTFLGNAFQLGLQALYLDLLIGHLLALGRRCAIALYPLVKAV